MGKGQRSRKQKISSGNGIKHKRTNLTPTQKILFGGGLLRGLPKRWAQAK